MSDAKDITAAKQALRARMLPQLQAMTTNDRTGRSEKVCARVADSGEWQLAQSVILFSPLRTEPQIVALETAAVSLGKRTFIIPQTLRSESDLELPFIPDLILVPGLAFSRDGHRLGRGGGFYDRLLGGRAANAFKLGVCFAFQLFESIPAETHDAVMNEIAAD